jgi:hypothetical protein
VLILFLRRLKPMRLDRRPVPKQVNPRISTSPLPAQIIELNDVRHDLLAVFGIWIHVLSGLEQREVFGAKFFLHKPSKAADDFPPPWSVEESDACFVVGDSARAEIDTSTFARCSMAMSKTNCRNRNRWEP